MALQRIIISLFRKVKYLEMKNVASKLLITMAIFFSLNFKSFRENDSLEKGLCSGLYKGILPQLLSMGPTSAIQFACYSTFTELYFHFKQDQLNIFEKFLCGSLSGGFGKTIVYPLDTIRKRLQVQGFEEGRKSLGQTQKYHGMINCISTMYKNENGLWAFYKGYVPGMAKAFISSGLYFSLFEFFKLVIVQRKKEEL